MPLLQQPLYFIEFWGRYLTGIDCIEGLAELATLAQQRAEEIP